jgi:protein SCO1/2
VTDRRDNGRRPRVAAAGAVMAVLALVMMAVVAVSSAEREFVVRGMVLRVDPASRTFVVSHEKIDGFMDAMTMSFEVREASTLTGLTPGAIVEFTLAVTDAAAYAERIRVRRYESVEQDPLTARRLTVLKRAAGFATTPLAVGDRVPEFTLVDQAGRRVTLSSLRGKVLAVNFIYTRCALPQFCLRVSNNFGVLQKRFARQLGAELVLLTITFDPQRDTPEVLARYASLWKADPRTWHFLTGPVADVRRVCSQFGLEYFPDEGLMNHTLRTAVVDRAGTIVASIEGNQYTPEQLGDLVQEALRP